METMTITFPVTKESIKFIRKALNEAQVLGFDVTAYLDQLEKSEVYVQIAELEARLAELKKLKKDNN